MEVQEQDQDQTLDHAANLGVLGENHREFLTFFLSDQEYGVDILRVQEIRQWSPTTPLPNVPTHVCGVINIRGTIVPIVDPRICFGMATIERSPMTVVIVLRTVRNDRERYVGLVVDAVSDVYDVAIDKIKATGDLGGGAVSQYTSGMIALDKKMVVLLDIDELVQVDDEQLDDVAQQEL